MDFLQTVNARYSCRSFLETPVDTDIVASLVETAQRAPSWGNTQPWRVWVAGGDTAISIRQSLVSQLESGREPCPEISMSQNFPEALQARYKDVGRALFAVLGINRDDAEKRKAHAVNNYNAFGAPALVYLTVPEGQTSYPLMDIGAFVSTFCLAATNRGLATCIQANLVRYPDIVRSCLPIPSEEKIVVGIALGYANDTAKANSFRSAREPVQNILTCTGFS